MTTTPDQAWARGATTAITMPPITPAPPPSPTYYPPVSGGNGDQPGRGPRRRLPRWIAGAAALAVVAGAGIAGGWALRSHDTTPAPVAAPTSTAPAVVAPTLTPDEAKTQTCAAYKTIGLQWTSAYKAWLAALPPNWTWDDPAVKTATNTFDAAATQQAAQLNSLIAVNTPLDVANAVQGVRGAIVALAASHGNTTGSATNDKIDATMARLDDANKVCGLG